MDVPSILVGAGIVLVSGLIVVVAHQVLSLRVDRIKGKRDKMEELLRRETISAALGGSITEPKVGYAIVSGDEPAHGALGTQSPQPERAKVSEEQPQDPEEAAAELFNKKETRIPPAVLTPAFRRIARPRGPFRKRQMKGDTEGNRQ